MLCRVARIHGEAQLKSTALEIQFARNDDETFKHGRRSLGPGRLGPEVLLNSLPSAVLIKLHACKHVDGNI